MKMKKFFFFLCCYPREKKTMTPIHPSVSSKTSCIFFFSFFIFYFLFLLGFIKRSMEMIHKISASMGIAGEETLVNNTIGWIYLIQRYQSITVHLCNCNPNLNSTVTNILCSSIYSSV